MTDAPPLASRLDRVKPSATVAIATRARELRAEGHDVLSFSVGEPDFEPAEHILDAARAAVATLSSKYTPARGIPELRQAVCVDSKARRGGHAHRPEEVVVSVGAKHSLFNLALALYQEGDEVIIPSPYWVSYPEQVKLAGADPVIVETTVEEGYRVRPEALAAAITDRTKGIILCSPSNPTGAAYSPAELSALAEVLRGHDFWIVTDEIYAHLVYGDFDQRSLLEVAPDLRDRLIIVDGVSKSYAMTGWRIGWTLGPAHVAKACDKIQSQSTTNPAAISQQAALAALTGPQGAIEEMRRTFEGRRDHIVAGLNAIDGVSCPTPEGAFYAFADVSGLVGRRAAGAVLEDDLAVARYLLEEAQCAVVPGTAFGAPGHVRISYAVSTETIDEGLRRIGAAVAKLS
jgi:aspartate aminotransferase